MGAVCCKDGAKEDNQGGAGRQAPAPFPGPTPSGKALANNSAEEPTLVTQIAQQPKDAGLAAPDQANPQAATSPAATPAAAEEVADPAQVQLNEFSGNERTGIPAKNVPTEAEPQGQEAAIVSPRVAVPTLTAEAEAAFQPVVAPAEAQPTDSAPPPVLVEQQAPALAAEQPVQAAAAPAAPAAGSTEQFNEGAPTPDVPSRPTATGNEKLLQYVSPSLAGSHGDGEKDQRVRVETTRRPGQGSTAPAEGSSTASYSQSAASSQHPGSSQQHGLGGSTVGAGSAMSPMGSSAAQQGNFTAGEAPMPTAPSAAGTTTGGVESIAGSAQDSTQSSATPASKNSSAGFMFGAPRMKEHRKDRRKGPKRGAKSHSSNSDVSGGAGQQPGSDVTGSKASSAGPPGAGSSAAVPATGSSNRDASLASSDNPTASTNVRFGGAPGSSFAPSTGGPNVDASIGSTGGADGFRSVGRRIKASLKGGPSGGSSSESNPARSASTAGRATSQTIGGGSGLLEEAVPEEEEEEEDEGEATDRSGSPRSSSEHLSIMSPPEGSDVENVLQLICNIFQLPVALVAAYRSSNIFIRSTAMKLTDDDQWRYSLAQWSMLNASDLRDVLLVPDATKDERFCKYYCVTKEPRVRFFMASPLRSSTGELLGTLCMADFNVRLLEPANLLVVNNLQTLVIRQLERDMSLAAERLENEAATEKLQQEMMRALDHFDKCIMFVDTSKPGWEVLYTNMAWEHVTGIPREHVMGRVAAADPSVPRVHVMGRPLQDFFMSLGGAALDWSSTAADVASRAEFTVHRVAVRQKPDKLVSLHLRLATDESTGDLEGLLPKGLPAWVKSRGNEAHNYFVFVEEATQTTGGSTVYEALAKHVEKVPGLELSHLLGKGGFGSVYYGTWNGMPVAVKMIDNKLTKTNTEGISLEALMGQELSHPNIVKTIKYVMRSALNASSMSGSNSRTGIGSNTRAGMSGGHLMMSTIVSSRNGSRNIAVLPTSHEAGAGAANNAGHGSAGNVGIAGGHVPGGRVSASGAQGAASPYYMTSAQPGLSAMTSAQMAAAADLTSASAMQHHYHPTIVTTMNSDATTAAGGGSQSSLPHAYGNMADQYGSGGMPPRVGNLIGSTPPTPGHGGGEDGGGTSAATSGLTAVGPASIQASSVSTAAGPPSIASGSHTPANANAMLSRESSGAKLQNPLRVKSSERPRSSGILPAPSPAGAGAAVPASQPYGVRFPASGMGPASPSARAPAAAPAGAAGYPPSTAVVPYPPPGTAAAAGVAGLTPEQQTAAMTSRYSLAFSTITSNGQMLAPGKGSPSSSSGPTTHMPQASVTSGEDMGEVWIIMEFCDRGSLQDALDRGALKLRKPSGEPGETHLPMMVATACEVASALHYLHDKGIVHGDLTAWNVMLCTASNPQNDRSGRNFTAKVADFGLSRTLDLRSKIKTRTYGTISHMPPECLISGIISKATDVFAFGVLLWQMYTGLRPWAGMNHGQIIYNVGMKNVQLIFPPGTPPAIADLSSSCTRTEPTKRPSFSEILSKLDGIRASLGL
ncbi:hypothetical protein Agub_g8325 [Astrephomene gubernaculifera]|uniref:Protein kinase domain-containing protein n=1 Tax=Astrephomene gubernaculifera TaxID=47775 RepID=A0AAD3DRG9_9CHLO|nr:hypothetical protein Agub_g8325 [Astrephomene gubernaculifera]